MKTSTQLIFSAAAALISLGAQAGMSVNAADLPRISNGGTGYIGLTASAGSERSAYMAARGAGSNSSVPTQAGEASTMANGVPNQQQFTSGTRDPAFDSASRADLRTMGQSGAGTAAVNPAWGTPK